MSVHKDLTGADLHEPKGADTATSGKVYVSDGAGSGVWTTASSVITNTAWSTGDLKVTLKTVADTTWIMGSAGSIGDGSSSATIRANADCEDLFLFLYSKFVDANAPVSGGRGASGAADWAAHKRITLPDMWGRAIGLAGAGSGLTSRAYFAKAGTETHTITRANLPNTSVTVTVTDPPVATRMWPPSRPAAEESLSTSSSSTSAPLTKSTPPSMSAEEPETRLLVTISALSIT